MMELQPQLIHSPELFGNFWLNSEPVSIRENLGNVILVDFWDYTCVNCIRTLPYIHEWHKRYREFGLVIVGVHTPEFRFAQSPTLVEKAIKRFNIEYPIVMDNDALVWSAFANRHWPTRYLIDKNGYIRFSQHGEGGYDQFERALQALLVETGYRDELPDLMPALREEDQPGAVCYKPTGELYAGYLRSSLGNLEGSVLESTIEYVDPGVYIPERFYAHGAWTNERESLRFAGSENGEGWLTLLYEAASLNAVMGTKDESQAVVKVMQGTLPIGKQFAGDDLEVTPSGESIVRVSTPRMYSLIKNVGFGERVARLVTTSDQLELFTFSFSTCAIPQFIHPN